MSRAIDPSDDPPGWLRGLADLTVRAVHPDSLLPGDPVS